jgi:SAM-dependent methyltransferase
MTPTRFPPPGTEALDSRVCDARVARATLRDIAVANWLFGGRAAVRYGVRTLLAGVPVGSQLTLLDVGAGNGDIARYLVRHAGTRATLRPLAVDWHPEAARLCHAAGIAAVVGDAAALPFPARAADIVVASQLLHHFGRAAAVQVLRALDRVARLGVVVADLERASTAAAVLWLASFALAFDRVSRRDGVISVRRGFTREELAHLLRGAGLAGAVHRRPGHRLVAVWRPAHADD